MEDTVLHGRKIIGGVVEGEAIVLTKPLNFGAAFYYSILSGADKLSVADPGHELYGKVITDKVLVYPTQHGSTGVSGSFLGTVKKGMAPCALVCNEIDPMMAAGVVFAEKILDRRVPTMDCLDKDPTSVIKTGDRVKVDADRGTVTVLRK
jgi:predicted aconitase with swiveling domain